MRVDTAELLNSFRKTELDSIESYEQVLQKEEPSDPGYNVLQQILEEHREAARLLGEQALKHGKVPVQRGESDPDPMSVLVDSSGTADEDPFAVKALKAREEETILNYQNALKRSELDEELRDLLGNQLLGNAKAHIQVLDQLLANV